MLSVVQKSPNLANALKATSYVVPNISVPPKVTFPANHEASTYVPQVFLTTAKMKSALPYGIGTPRVITSITSKFFVVHVIQKWFLLVIKIRNLSPHLRSVQPVMHVLLLQISFSSGFPTLM